MKRRSAWDRFWEKVEKTEDGCWLWTGCTNGRGYGVFEYNREGRTTVQAHRHAWYLLVGPPDPELTLDHLCRNRLCVNPEHMEEVTRGENTLRGDTLTAQNLAKTHCKRGHEFIEKNIIRRPSRPNHRECRTCHRAGEKKRQKKKAK